jgi:SAM-dependent methyltransferase
LKLKDEHLFSTIDDPGLLPEMEAVRGAWNADIKGAPAWIGGYYPKTSEPSLDIHVLVSADPYRIYRDYIRDHVDGDGRVLEIGSGAGAQTSLLSRYFSEVVGVESADVRVAFARKYNSHENVQYLHGRFPCDGITGKFDYVFCISVLYQNAASQRELVIAAHSLLVPGGKLFIYNPDTTQAEVDGWGLVTEKLGGPFDTCPAGRFVVTN